MYIQSSDAATEENVQIAGLSEDPDRRGPLRQPGIA